MPGSERPKASIIVRALNEEAHIGRLLTGIMEQTEEDTEIILVDSGSTDATVAIASQFPVRVETISPDEFTFGRSLNIGCRAATGEFLVIVSAHVYPVYRDWLAALLAPFQDPDVAMTYGKQRGDDRTSFSEHQIFKAWYPDEDVPPHDHPFANNANAAVRRSLWEQLPYDETLTGLEDIDWARRAIERGHRVVYCPTAEAIHVHEERPRQVFNRYRREAIALHRIFPEERLAPLETARLIVSNIAADARAAQQEGALRTELANILTFRTLQFAGAFRGFREDAALTPRLRRTLYYPPPPTHGARNGTAPTRERIDYTAPHHDD